MSRVRFRLVVTSKLIVTSPSNDRTWVGQKVYVCKEHIIEIQIRSEGHKDIRKGCQRQSETSFQKGGDSWSLCYENYIFDRLLKEYSLHCCCQVAVRKQEDKNEVIANRGRASRTKEKITAREDQGQYAFQKTIVWP